MLDAFKKCSGLEVNKSKTEGMWLGANKNNKEQPLGIQWPKDSICALGIHFSYNEEIGLKKNFENKLSSVTTLLNLWFPRNLTLRGRIIILKTVALSKLIYNTSMLTPPDRFVKRVNQSIAQFFWRKKVPKIKQTTMIGSKEKGGLDMPDFDAINSALKAAWIKRINDSNDNANHRRPKLRM